MAGGRTAEAFWLRRPIPRLNALLSTRFRHSRQHDQLDLFIDSAQTAAVNALVDALAARNASEARGALERLVRINRDHGQRFHADKLISALEAPAPEGPEQGVERLERMDREWVPAASALLGARRRDFLAPLWRDIGRALDPASFDPGNPERHASPSVPRGIRLGAHEAIGCRRAGLPERAGSARPACGGPIGGSATVPRASNRGSLCVVLRPKCSSS